MAMRPGLGRICLPSVLAACVAAGPPAADLPATATTEPAWYVRAVQDADGLLRQLRQARIGADERAGRVAEFVHKAVAVLDKADRRLAREVEGLAERRKDPAARRAANARALDAQERLLQSYGCRLALLRGQVYLAAAEALPADEKAREDYVNSARSTFSVLRINFWDVPSAWVSYIGEARACRLSGRLEAAAKALQPVLDVSAKDGAAAELQWAATLEKLEVALLTDPLEAISQATAWRQWPALKQQPIWQARADWLLARAWAAEAQRRKDDGDVPAAAEAIAAAAALLRGQVVIDVVAPYDRLALLARLDAQAGGQVMERDELLQWADALMVLDRHEAATFYRRAASMPGGPLSAERQYNWAVLAMKQGDLAMTAEVSDALLKHLAADHPQRDATTQLRAAALLKLLGRIPEGQAPAGLRQRVLSALEDLVTSRVDEKLRRDALRQWVSIRSREAGFGECLTMLTAQEPLVSGDAYLLYALAAGRWTALSAKPSSVSPVQAAAEARRVVAESEQAQRLAEKAGQDGLAARSALLRARVLASRPLVERQAALKVLSDCWSLLAGDEATAPPAAALRVEVLLEAGHTVEADRTLKELSGATAAASSRLLLAVAEALAARYVGQDPPGRKRVVELCDGAMRRALETGDRDLYATVAQRSGRAMLQVGAHADVETLLTKLLQSKRVRSDPKATLTCSLMLAEALQAGGELNEAKELLGGLAERFAQAPEAHLALGQLEMTLSQPGDAVECFRRARRLCRAGSPAWCRATLALAEALHARRDTTAAADVLRVSAALYPRFGSPELLARLKRLREKLGPARDAGAS